MEFYTQNGMTRPVRLCEETRRFAYESLNHKYGLDTRKTHAIPMDGIPGFSEMSRMEQHDLAIRKIAEDAPLRICKGERVSGAATLGLAISHRIPVTVEGKDIFWSVSHLTVDFPTVLRTGINGIRERAEKALLAHSGTDREPFARSVLSCLDSFDIWHARYIDALSAMPEYAENLENLRHVPHQPARSFYEAVQSIWFTFAFLRLTGNWPGIGRIDRMLGPYLEADLASGKLTLDEAREILAHFFIKGCEWVSGGNYGSGDAQHYQNLVLAGIGPDGEEVTNEVTYLVLDILEELGISDFPTSVRLSKNSDERLVHRVAEVMRFGGGMLAVYNEDLIIRSLTEHGYPLKEARDFANDGCWEVQVPGKTFFIYNPFDSLQILQKKTLRGYAEPLPYRSFEELYAQFAKDIHEVVEGYLADRSRKFTEESFKTGNWVWNSKAHATVVSIFEEGCIEKGYSYHDGGPIYNVYAPHIGGFADTVNALYAIKRLVWEEKKLTLDELCAILAKNWEGEEPLRQYVINHYTYYGNDNDEVDGIAARFVKDFAESCSSTDGKCGYKLHGGISTFGRQLNWKNDRLASPHGRRTGDVLAGNTSPTPGTDRAGATAVIRSYCKPDLSALPTGAALDLKLLPSSVEGEEGLEALKALLRGFVSLGGFFMQPDVVDASILHEAQEHPEDYQTLSVRVSGWNARFVTLGRSWQDMIIAQTES